MAKSIKGKELDPALKAGAKGAAKDAGESVSKTTVIAGAKKTAAKKAETIAPVARKKNLKVRPAAAGSTSKAPVKKTAAKKSVKKAAPKKAAKKAARKTTGAAPKKTVKKAVTNTLEKAVKKTVVKTVEAAAPAPTSSAKPDSAPKKAVKKAAKKAAPKKSAKKAVKKAAEKTAPPKAVKKAAKKAVKKVAPKKAATQKASTRKAAKKTAEKTVTKKTVKKAAKKAVKKAAPTRETVVQTARKAVATPKAASAPKPPMASMPERNDEQLAVREIAARRASLVNQSPTAVLTRERDIEGIEGEPVYPSAAPLREWPYDFGSTYLSLLVRDPQWLYAHWEISAEDRERYRIGRPQGAAPLVLRIYEFPRSDDAGEGGTIDTTVNLYATGWYINIPPHGLRWRAELGVIGESGRFVAICRSHEVTAPREIPAAIEPDPDFEPAIDETASAELFRLSADMAPTPEPHNGDAPFEASGETPPPPFAPPPLPTAQAVACRGMSSAEIAQRPVQPTVPAAPEVAPGASELVPLAPGAPASPEAVPSQPEKGQDFFLWVKTELIVYGGTEPDAKLTVQGQPVDLRPDGTFTLRFALPDGEQIVPVRAIKADDSEERTITPIVERSTK